MSVVKKIHYQLTEVGHADTKSPMERNQKQLSDFDLQEVEFKRELVLEVTEWTIYVILLKHYHVYLYKPGPEIDCWNRVKQIRVADIGLRDPKISSNFLLDHAILFQDYLNVELSQKFVFKVFVEYLVKPDSEKVFSLIEKDLPEYVEWFRDCLNNNYF